MSYLFMRDMSWLRKCVSSEQVGRSSMKTIKHFRGTGPNPPSVPFPNPVFLPISFLLFPLPLTDDNSKGAKGHGLTAKGIISSDNHCCDTGSKQPQLAAENNNNRQ